MTDPRSIAVIGAGFSGTILVAHLLRSSQGPLRIHLINRSGRLARGVAYGTRSSRHVLNVPAGRMSAFAEDESDFLRFAQQRDPSITGGSFVPRRLYGDYLEHILLSAQSGSARGTVLSHLADEAVAIDVDGDRPRIRLVHGNPLAVDHVVLASGNYAPSAPRLADNAFRNDPRFVGDPWKPLAINGIRVDRPVAIIGTGLTMVDVALELAGRGHTGGMIAISRRGLLPQPHRRGTAPPACDQLPLDLVACAPTAANYLRAVRQHVARLQREGVDWREVIASLRPVTPSLWRALPDAERARFLRHLRSYWDIHRHRMAPALWESLQSLLQGGDLRIVAGRLTSIVTTPEGLTVSYRGRHQDAVTTIPVAAVVNCSGPEGDVRRLRDPLIGDLLRRGLATCDAAGLGLRVDENYRLLSSNGSASSVLSLTGPLLKGAFWEATAVPELRVHAARLAGRLAGVLERVES